MRRATSRAKHCPRLPDVGAWPPLQSRSAHPRISNAAHQHKNPRSPLPLRAPDRALAVPVPAVNHRRPRRLRGRERKPPLTALQLARVRSLWCGGSLRETPLICTNAVHSPNFGPHWAQPLQSPTPLRRAHPRERRPRCDRPLRAGEPARPAVGWGPRGPRFALAEPTLSGHQNHLDANHQRSWAVVLPALVGACADVRHGEGREPLVAVLLRCTVAVLSGGITEEIGRCRSYSVRLDRAGHCSVSSLSLARSSFMSSPA
ncbi:hypothetical protein IW256_000463 [Actinomadura viridis]|uniref:Uncharacterized protein n=1 Tax=Actinomadura viridis TaxID=58110 RepID=A0A931DA16_9ACTN|nr:hypothetical protein [Actinomadura viridis]